jgi:kumamolisin
MRGMESRVPVPGSDRSPVPGAKRVGDADPARRIQVTITLRRRGGADPAAALDQAPLDRATFAERFGADPADIARVEAFAAAHGLDVVEASVARRSVVLAGTVAAMSAAFGVELGQFEEPSGGTFQGRTGPVTVPADLGDAVESVLGLDERPAARPHFRQVIAPRAAGDGYRPQDVAALYDFPEGTGRGETIALIELGGGFTRADLAAYWRANGISPAPEVVAVSVDGAANAPGDPADSEVMLDIEVAGAVAPGARLAVYFAPNTTNGFLDAITTAIHDDARSPSVVSISWGLAEDQWTQQARTAYDQAFRDAAALGVTVCCAAGDDGSADNVEDGQAHVDFPAASPFALGCGGTRLDAQGSRIVSEVVWNEPGQGATGGGVSRFFGPPDYQAGAGVPTQTDTGEAGRGVPDVAGDADPLTGYRVRVNGEDVVIGGTSAVAPLYAALLARINERAGRAVGFANPRLYARRGLRDITEGSNGAYRARRGWDACTGLGSPGGAAIVAALGG